MEIARVIKKRFRTYVNTFVTQEKVVRIYR